MAEAEKAGGDLIAVALHTLTRRQLITIGIALAATALAAIFHGRHLPRDRVDEPGVIRPAAARLRLLLPAPPSRLRAPARAAGR